MPLVVVNQGAIRFLLAITNNVPLIAWPYKNDRVPKIGDTIAAYSECDFSGYDGPKTLTGWTAPVVEGERGITRANSVSWTHNGGPDNNNAYGVVWIETVGGLLVCAERLPSAPVVIDSDHRTLSYRAVLTDRSDFSP